MQFFLVGGAVRDALLGLKIVDRDWVVVGSTAQAMTRLGYLPVGKDFPVFLHPDTREEYALARTERKTAPGYRGFLVHAAPDVSLIEDLARRDLTINSIAANVRTGCRSTNFSCDFETLIDPYGGQADLHAKVLRHVTQAFREDPVRILRVARFAARLPEFSVATQTLALMQLMVASGEADALVPERVWQELARGLMATKPSRMLDVLHNCGALPKLLPGVHASGHVPQALDMAARMNAPLPVRFACLMHDPSGAPPAQQLARLKTVCTQLRVPLDCKDLADVLTREHRWIEQSSTASSAALVHLLERCDAFRKPQRFADMLLACEYTACGQQDTPPPVATSTQPQPQPQQYQPTDLPPYPQRQHLLGVLAAAQAVSTQAIASAAQAAGADGQAIGTMVRAARIAAVDRSSAPGCAVKLTATPS